MPEGIPPVSLGEGRTPLLERTIDVRPAMLKLDFAQPTGSFKDRGASVLLTVVKHAGATEVVEDSSGNAGAAVSAYSAAAGIACTIFTPEYTPEGKLVQIRHYGSRIVKVAGSRQDANTAALEAAYQELKTTQSQMLQTEKMASIGQLAAGVAHEINNPIGFISSNLNTLQKYTDRMTEFTRVQRDVVAHEASEAAREQLASEFKRLKLDHIVDDIPQLIAESLDGANRVRKIVQDLKTFSRVDETDYKDSDVIECLESTINIVWNELKYKVTLHKDYGEIPHIKCYSQQLNQVFMNLLINGAQAIDKEGEITIRTWQEDNGIGISFTDTGSVIPEATLGRIFEPFFTTKEIGKGTGLGLSISYDIIKNHGGDIQVSSTEGAGTTFTISLPFNGGGER